MEKKNIDIACGKYGSGFKTLVEKGGIFEEFGRYCWDHHLPNEAFQTFYKKFFDNKWEDIKKPGENTRRRLMECIMKGWFKTGQEFRVKLTGKLIDSINAGGNSAAEVAEILNPANLKGEISSAKEEEIDAKLKKARLRDILGEEATTSSAKIDSKTMEEIETTKKSLHEASEEAKENRDWRNYRSEKFSTKGERLMSRFTEYYEQVNELYKQVGGLEVQLDKLLGAHQKDEKEIARVQKKLDRKGKKLMRLRSKQLDREEKLGKEISMTHEREQWRQVALKEATRWLGIQDIRTIEEFKVPISQDPTDPHGQTLTVKIPEGGVLFGSPQNPYDPKSTGPLYIQFQIEGQEEIHTTDITGFRQKFIVEYQGYEDIQNTDIGELNDILGFEPKVGTQIFRIAPDEKSGEEKETNIFIEKVIPGPNGGMLFELRDPASPDGKVETERESEYQFTTSPEVLQRKRRQKLFNTGQLKSLVTRRVYVERVPHEVIKNPLPGERESFIYTEPPYKDAAAKLEGLRDGDGKEFLRLIIPSKGVDKVFDRPRRKPDYNQPEQDQTPETLRVADLPELEKVRSLTLGIARKENDEKPTEEPQKEIPLGGLVKGEARQVPTEGPDATVYQFPADKAGKQKKPPILGRLKSFFGRGDKAETSGSDVISIIERRRRARGGSDGATGGERGEPPSKEGSSTAVASSDSSGTTSTSSGIIAPIPLPKKTGTVTDLNEWKIGRKKGGDYSAMTADRDELLEDETEEDAGAAMADPTATDDATDENPMAGLGGDMGDTEKAPTSPSTSRGIVEDRPLYQDKLEARPYDEVVKTGGMSEARGSFLKTLWRQTRFMSMNDLWEMGKAMYEFHDRRFRRNQQEKFSDAARHVKYFAPEMQRIHQQAENERVNQYKEAIEQMGVWEIEERLHITRDRDELKACFQVLSTKGQLRLDDIDTWKAVNRFVPAEHHIPIPANGDPTTQMSKTDPRTGLVFLEGALDYLWGEGSYSGWFSENKSNYRSGIQKYYEKGDELEGVNLGHRVRLAEMLLKHKKGEYVDPQEYEGLIQHSIEKGKIDGENKFYYMVEGVAAKSPAGRTILSFDRIAHLNSTMLANFPLLQYMCGAPARADKGEAYKFSLEDYKQWQKYFDQDNPMNNKPNQRVVDFMWKYAIPSHDNIERSNKDLRNADKLDHDDMHMILPVTSTAVVTNACQTVGGGGKELLTKEGYMNSFVGYSQYFKVLSEQNKKTKLRDAIQSYVRFESIMLNKYKRNKVGYARLDASLLEKRPVVSEFNVKTLTKTMNPMINQILEAYSVLPETTPRQRQIIHRMTELLYRTEEEWNVLSPQQEKKDNDELTRYLDGFDNFFSKLVSIDNGEAMINITRSTNLIGYEYMTPEVKERRKQQLAQLTGSGAQEAA